MTKASSIRRVCNSWYHYKWFRILLLLVGIDMFILGFCFALGINILVFFAGISGTIIRALIGIAYILASGYIIKHSLHYKKHMKESYLLCQHCTEQLEVPEPREEE